VGVGVGLLLEIEDRHRIKCHSNRHMLGRILGSTIHPKDLYLMCHIDRLPFMGLCIEHHRNSSIIFLSNNNSLDRFLRTDRGLKTLYQHILPLELGALTLRTDVGLVESHTIREIVLLRRQELSDLLDY
jgi:hypothetical protein